MLRLTLPTFFVLLCIAVLLFSTSSAVAQPLKSKRITLEAETITLDHLVREMAQQSGLTLDTDPNDPLSALPLTAYLTDLPADTVAAALVDLLSARRAAWRWERLADRPGEGPGVLPADFKPGIAYRLRPSSGARTYAARTRSRILEDLATAISRAGNTDTGSAPLADPGSVAKTLEGLQANAPVFPENRPPTQAENEQIGDWGRKVAAANRSLAQICLFHLSAEQRESLARGESLRVPSESIDKGLLAGLAAATTPQAARERRFGAGPNGEMVRLSAIGPSRFSLDLRTMRDDFHVAPVLTVLARRTVKLGYDNVVTGGGSSGTLLDTVGESAEVRWRKILNEEWTRAEQAVPALPDSLSLANLAVRPKEEVREQRISTRFFAAPFTRMYEAAKASEKRLNILARLATFGGGASDPLADYRVSDLGRARKALLETRCTLTRWSVARSPQGGILIANALPHIWTSGPDKLVPPRIRADYFARRRADPNGFMSFDALCELARRLSVEALEALLQEDDPESENAERKAALPPLTAVADLSKDAHDLLAALGRNPGWRRQIALPEGIDLSDPSFAELRPTLTNLLPHRIVEFIDDPDAAARDREEALRGRLRLTITEEPGDEIDRLHGIRRRALVRTFVLSLRYSTGGQSLSASQYAPTP